MATSSRSTRRSATRPTVRQAATGCAALAAERPQLLVTNLMVASAMLNCLWAVTEQGSVPYSEVYLDVVHNAARSRVAGSASEWTPPDGSGLSFGAHRSAGRKSGRSQFRSLFVTQEQSANPFRPGNGVLPAYLAGRERPLAEFDAFVADPHPLHANWTVTGLRGTGKTVLVETAAARAEAAGWLTLERELGERHRDDARLAEAIEQDVDALLRRCGLAAALEQSVARGARLLRPARISVAGVSFRPEPLAARAPADRMRDALVRLSDALADAGRAGALLLYDEAHLLADDRSRERYPLSSFLAALGGVQRTGEPRVRVVLTGLPTLSVNLKRARTYAERMFRHVVLANLERGDAWDALDPARPNLATISRRRSSARSSRRPEAIRTSCSSSALTSGDRSLLQR